jgi:ATP-binding cassette, subfamily B, multidrug efflux pump
MPPGMRHAAEIPDGFKIDFAVVSRILSFLKPYKLHVFIALLCLVLFSALQLAGPYLIKTAIDGPIAEQDFNGLMRITILYLATIVGSFFALFAQIYTMALTGQSIMNDLRKSLFRHIQSLDIRFFDRFPVGWVITRLTTDIEMLNELFTSGVVQFIGDFLTLTGIVVIMFFLNAELTLLVLFSMVLFGLNVILFRKKFRESFRAVREKVAAITGFLSEHIRGMHVIQLFNKYIHVQNRFDKTNRDTLNAHLKTVYYFALFVPTVEITSAIVIVLLLRFGGRMVQTETITIGVLVAFFQYARRFFRPIQDMSQKFNILQSALASSERIFQVMDMRSQIVEPDVSEAVVPDTIKGEIVFENVWFAYQGNDWILKNISFQISPGESIAIVGATGAGKTTITNLLCRFYDPAKGVIRLDGIDIRKIPVKVLRSYFGLIHQDAVIFTGSIADNIRVGRSDISDENLWSISRNSGLESFIRRLSSEFETQAGESGSRLSAGEKQLVSFIRTMSFDPEIVILDEATSNVDTSTEYVLQKATETLLRSKTALVVAHRLSTIQHVNRIFVMHHGVLVEQGTHEALMNNPEGIYPRLYQLYYAGQSA